MAKIEKEKKKTTLLWREISRLSRVSNLLFHLPQILSKPTSFRSIIILIRLIGAALHVQWKHQ